MDKVKIIVVDDEEVIRESLQLWLNEAGYTVFTAGNGETALQIIEKEKINILIVDLRMPGMDGIEVFKKAKKIISPLFAIFITAYGTVESAVVAMKEGAYDFIEKPFCPERVELLIKKVVEHQRLTLENIALKKELKKKFEFEDIIGKSHKMQKIFELIETVAQSNATMLILGDTGTGKELVARAIHSKSIRSNAPFVAVSCSALPESLLETELFGYEKGAFTGADKTKKGKFEFADCGTLFLDEIGDISPNIQLHLLRVLQEKEFSRVGGNEVVRVDVRLISATNKNLAKLVQNGKFREDLYYRLNVVTINLPLLKERKEDILLLANHFLEKFNRENSKNISKFSNEVIEFFLRYNWPGNVRELQNFIEHSVIICKDDIIKLSDLPDIDRENKCLKPVKTMEEMEKEHIIKVMEETEQNLTKTAETLGITRPTLYNKIKKYQITVNNLNSTV